MKTLQVSDEVYQKLMTFVVDPFEDTAETVITRLVEIGDKARQQYGRLEARRRDRGTYAGQERRAGEDNDSVRERTRIPDIPINGPEVIL